MKKHFLVGGIFIMILYGISSASYLSQLPHNKLHYFTQFLQAQEELNQQCFPTYIERGLALAKKILPKIQTIIQYKSDPDARIFTQKIYNAISDNYPNFQEKNNAHDCTNTTLFISLQKELLQIQQKIIKRNELESDFGGPSLTKTKSEKNKAFVSSLIEKLAQSPSFQTQSSLSPNQITTEKNGTLVFSTQSVETQKNNDSFNKQLLRYITNVVQKTILQLYQEGFYSTEEYNDVLSKLHITYHPNSCNNYKGFLNTTDFFTNNKLTHTTLKEIELSFYGCNNVFWITDNERLIKQLVLHEAGGHFAHNFKDQHRQEFTSICWNSDGTIKPGCDLQAFVSDYAKESPFEDYAETFAFWKLDNLTIDNSILQKKMKYMKNMFQEVTK